MNTPSSPPTFTVRHHKMGEIEYSAIDSTTENLFGRLTKIRFACVVSDLD